MGCPKNHYGRPERIGGWLLRTRHHLYTTEHTQHPSHPDRPTHRHKLPSPRQSPTGTHPQHRCQSTRKTRDDATTTTTPTHSRHEWLTMARGFQYKAAGSSMAHHIHQTLSNTCLQHELAKARLGVNKTSDPIHMKAPPTHDKTKNAKEGRISVRLSVFQ